MKNLIKSMICAGLLFFTTQAFSAQYTLTITGDFEKLPFFPQAFGSTDASLPLNMSVTVDDQDPSVVFVPAGTVLQPSGMSFSHDITAFNATAVVSASLTLGDTTWTATDLAVRSFNSIAADYIMYVEGALADGSIGRVYFDLDSASLGFAVSSDPISCAGLVCEMVDIGTAGDALGFEGSLSNMQAAIALVGGVPTSSELVQALLDDVSALNDKRLSYLLGKLRLLSGHIDGKLYKWNLSHMKQLEKTIYWQRFHANRFLQISEDLRAKGQIAQADYKLRQSEAQAAKADYHQNILDNYLEYITNVTLERTYKELDRVIRCKFITAEQGEEIRAALDVIAESLQN